MEDDRVRGLACLDGDWLTQLYVHPEYHNRGIGTALLDHVKRERPDGFQLWTFQANDGARRFYERHGCMAENSPTAAATKRNCRMSGMYGSHRPRAYSKMPRRDEHAACCISARSGRRRIGISR